MLFVRLDKDENVYLGMGQSSAEEMNRNSAPKKRNSRMGGSSSLIAASTSFPALLTVQRL